LQNGAPISGGDDRKGFTTKFVHQKMCVLEVDSFGAVAEGGLRSTAVSFWMGLVWPIFATNLERNLALFALAAWTSDLVFVDQVFVLNVNALNNRKRVPLMTA
jgi:hypothetical protein